MFNQIGQLSVEKVCIKNIPGPCMLEKYSYTESVGHKNNQNKQYRQKPRRSSLGRLRQAVGGNVLQKERWYEVNC